MDTQDKAYGLTDQQKKYKQWLDILKENKLFTPGLAYWKSDIDRDIVSDFIDKYSVAKPDRPRLYTADHDIFSVEDPLATIYIGDKEFKFNVARNIYVCPLQTWPMLSAHLDSCGFVNKNTLEFCKLIHQSDIKMLDPGSSRFGMMGDIISVDAWCMYTNMFCNVFVSYEGPYNPPVAKQFSSSEVMIEDGKLFFEGKLGVE